MTDGTVSAVRDAPAVHPPIFLFGAHRSGTTLLNLIIGAHPQLRHVGEHDYLLRALQPGPDGALRYDEERLRRDRVFRTRGRANLITGDGVADFSALVSAIVGSGTARTVITIHEDIEKLPLVVENPHVILLERDPRDVADSVRAMGWTGSAVTGVDRWIAADRSWARLCEVLPPENRLELRYEDLLTDTEAVLARLCDFIGVTYDPAMLRYHETSTYAPIDPTHVERWRKKLDPTSLALIEGRLGDRLTARGYRPSGVPPRDPSALGWKLIRLRDRLRRLWRGFRNHGPRLFVLERAYRYLGLRNRHDRILQELFALKMRRLK